MRRHKMQLSQNGAGLLPKVVSMSWVRHKFWRAGSGSLLRNGCAGARQRVEGAVPCRCAGDVQAQQLVVTQFESVGTTFQLPAERSDRFELATCSLEVDHCYAGGILQVARRVWQSGETSLFASSVRGVGRLVLTALFKEFVSRTT